MTGNGSYSPPTLIITPEMLNALLRGKSTMLRAFRGVGGCHLDKCDSNEREIDVLESENQRTKRKLIIYAEKINGMYNITIRNNVADEYSIILRDGNVTRPMDVKTHIIHELDYFIGSKLTVLAHEIKTMNVSTTNSGEMIDFEYLRRKMAENYAARKHELDE